MAYFTASCDSVVDNTRFAEELELDFPILSDPEKSVATQYGVVTEDRALPFRWTFTIGVDGKILHIDRDVDPSTHGADIATRLEDLGVDKREE